jgi:hypothetical protein
VNGYPTCDDVLAFLQEQGQAAMVNVIKVLRDSERRARNAAEQSVKAFQQLQMKYEPPPATPGWRSYVAKPESSD